MSSKTGQEVNILASLGIKPLSKASNYREWRLAVVDILAEKGYWPIVSGKTECPESGEAKTLWEEKAIKARGMMGRLLDSAHRELYAEDRDPKLLWTKLEKRYAGKDQARIWFLREELSKVEYRDDNLVDYISSLEKLFHQLAAAGEVQSEKDKKYLLLSKLPQTYHPFRTSICNNADYDETKYDAICDRLVLEHQQLTKATTEDPETTNAFYAGKNARGGASRRGGSEKGPGGKEERVGKDSCFFCKEKGHWANKCPAKQQAKRRPGRGRGGRREGFGNAGRPSQSANRAVVERGGTPQAWTAMDEKSAKVSQSKWVLDSGATNHMTSDRTLFQQMNPVQTPIHIANGDTMMAEGEGDVVIGLVVNGVKNPVVLKRVLYVPEMGSSGLVSVRCIQAAGGVVSFAGNTVSIKHGRELYGIAKLEQNAYILQTENIEAKPASAGITTKHATLHDWHCRLGHISYDNVKRLAEDHPEITIDGSRTNPTCVSCVATKQTRTPNHFPSTRITTAPLELIHTDLAGPMKIPSIGGARYFLLFIDDHTRYTMVYTLHQKSETFSKFKEYKALVENYHNGKIKALRSDNGGEYTSNEFSKFLRESGISHETTAPYSPEQNGVSERATRTLIGRAKAMILENELHDNLWAEAIHTAVYLKNRCPTTSKISTPYQLWTGQRANLSHLIPFGTLAFHHILKAKRSKWEKNGQESRVVGYAGTNQYRVVVGSKILIVRDILVINNNNTTEELQLLDENKTIEFISDSEDESAPEIATLEVENQPSPTIVPALPELPETPQPETPQERQRIPRPCNTPATPTLASSMPRRETTGKFTSTRSHHQAFLATRSLDPDQPASYTEALNSTLAPEWNIAIDEELKSIIDNGTWEIVDQPRGRTPVKCQWVFRVKRGANGEVVRYKARLVAKGFTQQYGIDYLETFAPVVKLTSLRIILALAAARNYQIDQTDIQSAYLLGKLEEEIYIELPEGLEIGEENSRYSRRRQVCKLLKGLYGLKQSGRIWNQEWDKHLVGTCRFTRSKDDHAVYLKSNGEDYCWVLIWVDDVLWVGPWTMVDEAKTLLANQFPVTDLGRGHYFLGIEIIQLPRQITLNQSTYIQKILERFNMTHAYRVSTPLAPGTKLERTRITQDAEFEDSDADEKEYRSMIGSLMYLMLCTRPDIAFAVGALSRYNNAPNSSHMVDAKHLFRYVKKTSHIFLRLGPFVIKDLYPVLYCDADWAGDVDTRKSTGGYVCALTEDNPLRDEPRRSAVSWSSKRQPTVALSSTEAEYIGLTQATKEAIWVSQFIRELQTVPINPAAEDTTTEDTTEESTP